MKHHIKHQVIVLRLVITDGNRAIKEKIANSSKTVLLASELYLLSCIS